MLRILVLVLVAANVLYFGWAHWGADRRPVLTAVANAGNPAQARPRNLPPPPCATLGPFHDEVLANQAEKQLVESGWRPQRRATNEDLHDGWWVYVVNTSAAAQARTLDAVQKSGLRDAFAMPEDTEFRVSVGLFSDEKRAEERARRVQGLKLQAVVKERLKPQPVVWFDLPGMSREALSDGRLTNTGLPLDALRIEACPAPATEDSAPATPAAPPAGSVPAGEAGAGNTGSPQAASVARV